MFCILYSFRNYSKLRQSLKVVLTYYCTKYCSLMFIAKLHHNLNTRIINTVTQKHHCLLHLIITDMLSWVSQCSFTHNVQSHREVSLLLQTMGFIKLSRFRQFWHSRQAWLSEASGKMCYSLCCHEYVGLGWLLSYSTKQYSQHYFVHWI